MPKHILIIGPTCSGKSEWAENLASKLHDKVIYVATAIENPADFQWQTRIKKHRDRRPPDWKTLSVPYNLTEVINTTRSPFCLLIDSIGSWVANKLDENDEDWDQNVIELLKCVKKTPVNLIFVAEETGWGVVPAYPLGRLFRDRLGSLVSKLGTRVDTTYLVIGGHVINLSVLGQKIQSN
ncbi:MAG: adenosylcobinamide-phosphate guanylyltransferase [Candidatus Atelocyanobacterium thalassa isolate SIO64986]|uniref:Adenosylcobinamide kinase n=1 Tax=Candidatus Atelocyanobacterium thalassa isolate SIO64986 TaxID=1527444 RepID=A0A086CGM5_9CHRO|nr:MAG: adenosylcobinamide-phosphate guanylyltransferase [Candidatus Atelocyanobacterium thalassa isolate SIO64986]